MNGDESLRTKDLRSRFERWVRRSWHWSFVKLLKQKHPSGAYVNFDLQQAWHHWRAGFLAGRRAK